MNRTLFLLALLLTSMVPYSIAHAAIVRSDVWNPSTLSGPLVICWGGPTLGFDGNQQPIPNPDACHNLCDLMSQDINVIYYEIEFTIWVIAPVSFAAGGIMYMLAGANPNLESTAKSVLKGAVWGVVIVLCSYIIVATVVGAFSGALNK